MDACVASFSEAIEADATLSEFPNMMETDDTVLGFAQELARRMSQTFAEVRLRQAKGARPTCSCGAKMHWHRNTSWKRSNLSGEIQVNDAYAYCRTCGKSARPLHGCIGTDRERWSLQVQEAVVDLASDESCGNAVRKLRRHHPGVVMERTSALRLLHEHGTRARQFIQEKLTAAVNDACKEGHKGNLVELEVEFDGGMTPVATLEHIETKPGQEPERTPIRGLPKRQRVCRWEETKLGLVQVPGEVTRLYSVRPTNELDEAFDDLFALACFKGWGPTTEVRGIADGARHIRPRMADAFNGSHFRFILDRPHAKEHLSDAAELMQTAGAIESKEAPAAEAIKRIEAGRTAEVVAELRAAFERTGQDELRKEANYFERNQDAMDYGTYRERGWSTASSEAESGHRHVVQVRLKISGAWWHPDNVANILALRMLKANDWWDEYWAVQRQKWRERAKQFAAAGTDEPAAA
jgi:hypothetical protein